jgi:hypothetical protein
LPNSSTYKRKRIQVNFPSQVVASRSIGTYAVVLDDDSSSTVVLDDLVFSILGSTTGDGARSGVLLDSDSVLADVLVPYIGECAGAKAVDTLSLVSTLKSKGQHLMLKNRDQELVQTYDDNV